MGSQEQTELEAFLAMRDAPCPVCRYNLRALKSDHCPECGRHLVLAVGTTEPKLGSFILGLVGLSAGLGFCGLLLAYVALWMIGRGGGPPRADAIKLLLGTIVCGIALWQWLSKRRVLGKRPDVVRWACAAACLGVGLAFPVWFILTIR